MHHFTYSLITHPIYSTALPNSYRTYSLWKWALLESAIQIGWFLKIFFVVHLFTLRSLTFCGIVKGSSGALMHQKKNLQKSSNLIQSWYQSSLSLVICSVKFWWSSGKKYWNFGSCEFQIPARNSLVMSGDFMWKSFDNFYQLQTNSLW